MEGHSPVERLLEIYDHHIWKELEKVDAFGPETGCLGLCGKRVDAIEYYKQQIKSFDKRMALEQEKILKDSKALLPVAFVSFSSRWGAAVCAQTTQSKNPTLWLTN
ncbi:putative 10TM putative phosphate transporter, cytosolic domain-containing protein [Rosa chinensis]|uniref:Putative 10TM putative phosphate transporter, cytosolic domain-containing protein n=1 Tax=Rosa chinensis TaxID=74649 RepID=A0A2P6RUS8_ROSCH|nr:putative 10TM putative phosphate transporter, cytosolic domain-containing protein [Rosa chinensis]